MLIDKVDAKEVQNHATKNVICECSIKILIGGHHDLTRILHTSQVKSKKSLLYFPHLSAFARRLFCQLCNFKFLDLHYIPVKTNCPTVAENPDRKALNGYLFNQYA